MYLTQPTPGGKSPVSGISGASRPTGHLNLRHRRDSHDALGRSCCGTHRSHKEKLIATLLICTVFLSLNIGRLLHGGIYLITEREEDAVEISGTISSIENLSRFSFPELNKEYRTVQPNGAKIMVGDIPCVATSSGDFAVGDYVTVLYLPQSKYVLSIEKVSHNT